MVMTINMKKVEKNRIGPSLNLTNLQIITALGRTRCTCTRWKDDPRDHNRYKLGRFHRQFSVVFTRLSVFRGPILWFGKEMFIIEARIQWSDNYLVTYHLVVFAYTDWHRYLLRKYIRGKVCRVWLISFSVRLSVSKDELRKLEAF